MDKHWKRLVVEVPRRYIKLNPRHLAELTSPTQFTPQQAHLAEPYSTDFGFMNIFERL